MLHRSDFHCRVLQNEVKVGAVTIKAMEAFDRTALVTESDPEVKLAGKLPQDMDKIAVNYTNG